MPHPELIDIWSVHGRFTQVIYSPKGGIEGLMIDTDGIATQFVVDANDGAAAELIASLRPGQMLQVEGSEAPPSHKGEAQHTVYDFERIASIDGRAPAASSAHEQAAGQVVRFNYAKHGAPNGVVLDTGDFIHTKPDGFERLGLKIGDAVKAEGTARPLVEGLSGKARVIEARTVNGQAVKPTPHPEA